MKKLFHKNQIIITALALMIVVAGYLNFTGQDVTTGQLITGSGEKAEKSAQDIEKKDTSYKKSKETSLPGENQKEETAQNQEESTETMTKDIAQEEEETLTVADNGEILSSKENPGEAVMVSNTIGADYFSSAKLSREQTRAKNKETLLEIVNNKQINSADKKEAVEEVAHLTRLSEKENAAEMMLQAKGFANAMVSLSEKNADVIVNAQELSSKEMAQIMDIVKRKTEMAAENIVITPVQIEKK